MRVWSKFNKCLVPIALAGAISIGAMATPADAYTSGSTYKWDGHSWTDCSGRTTVRDVSWKYSSGTIRLQVFYCTQGFYFARSSSTYRTGLLVEMWRENPYRLDMQTYTGYAVMSNGVAKRGYTCYHAAFDNAHQLKFCA